VRLAFLGTPEVAAVTLRAVVGAGHDVRVVVTRPAARRGRGAQVSPSPVQQAAAELGLPVAHSAGEVVGSGAELGVVVAYGRIIKPEVLAKLAMVNVHFSLLPLWRGAAPVERAILSGDRETGVCLMRLDEGLDTGAVFSRRELPIGPDETADELRQRLGDAGNELLLEGLAAGLPNPTPQEGTPTYAPKISPNDLRLDFSSPAELCYRVVRVGRAWTTWRGKRLIVHSARVAGPGLVAEAGALSPGQLRGNIVGTGDGALELRMVQAEGRSLVNAIEWARGARPGPGERLGT